MITFLTRPIIPFRLREAKYALLGRVDTLRGREPRRLPEHGGHAAVNRSIFQGLRQLGVPYTIDPPRYCEVGDVVICLADPRSIWQAIKWKRSGRIKKLFAGFAIVGSPYDSSSVILDPAVDRYVCFSDWHVQSFDLQAPGFKAKAVVCPCGVDPEAWSPAGDEDRPKENILFYRKRAPRPLYEDSLARARAAGFKVEEVIWGSYKLADYSAALRHNSLLLHWNNVETQGISMAEAWAADVPTLVYDPEEVRVIHGKQYVFPGDASPYLTPTTGRFYHDGKELFNLLEDWRNQKLRFNPRAWVVANLTEELCATKLMHSLNLA